MAKAKTKSKTLARQPRELDGVYILKIVLYLVIGAQWVRLTDPALTKQVPLPFGLVVGGLFAMHDHFQIDRKIEFAILLIACFIGYWSQSGLLIAVL
jgi:hypothetical protein